MKGRDITKQAIWTELVALGFRSVKFKGQMGYYEIGAALPVDGSVRTEQDGRVRWVDRLVIEPASKGQWSIDAKSSPGLLWVGPRAILRNVRAILSNTRN